MRTRVETLLGVDCRQMWISTFHALCARLLRREAPHIGLSRDFVIYDSTDQLTVMKQALRQLGMDDSQRAAAAGAVANQPRQEPDGRAGDLHREPPGTRATQQIGKLYGMYLQALKDANALDFDDLLLKTVELFEKSEHVRERYSEKFRFLMVDEYQDTNRPQYLLIQQLAARHRNLCVVGDPDQSIYKWRGADLRNILDFEHDFPGSDDRPARAQLPLDAGHSRRGVGGHRAEPQSQGEAALHRPRRAARRSCTTAPATTRRGGVHRPHVARRRCTRTSRTRSPILYRTNAQSRTLEDALRRSGIAYKIIGGVRFYERKEIKDALAYLQARSESARRRQPAARHQRAGARHRQGRMESLDAVDLGERLTPILPPLLAGLQPVATNNSLWARLVHAVEQPAARAARHRRRSRRFAICIVGLTAMARARRRCRSRSARCSTRAATCRTCARSAARRRKAGSRT